jgi:flagellar hook protein FlgE
MSVFQQGLSGLNASQRNLEVISNNISNANAAGFKASFAQFSDLYNGGGSGDGVGAGTQLSNINRQFTQGNVLTTNNPLDFAISGEGFFKVQSEKGGTIYTRNGQFGLDKDGFVVNSQGDKLQALNIDNNTKITSEKAAPLQIKKEAIAPKATEELSTKVNLDARGQIITAPFDIANPATYQSSVTQTVYNDLGETKTAQFFFQRTTAPAGSDRAWNVFMTLDNENVPAKVAAGNATPMGTLTFDQLGKATGSQVLNMSAANMSATGMGFSKEITLDLSDTTQFSSGFSIFNLSQNGYDSAAFKNFSVEADGTISLSYSNGQTQPLARIPLYKFNNPEGLQPLGASGFLATLEAGSEIISTGGDSEFGSIRSGAIEEANVDLTNELVAMITAQRIYQANSQSIKTQDSLLQTVTNLR